MSTGSKTSSFETITARRSDRQQRQGSILAVHLARVDGVLYVDYRAIRLVNVHRIKNVVLRDDHRKKIRSATAPGKHPCRPSRPRGWSSVCRLPGDSPCEWPPDQKRRPSRRSPQEDRGPDLSFQTTPPASAVTRPLRCAKCTPSCRRNAESCGNTTSPMALTSRPPWGMWPP